MFTDKVLTLWTLMAGKPAMKCLTYTLMAGKPATACLDISLVVSKPANGSDT